MKGQTLVRLLARSAVWVGATPRPHLQDSRRAQVKVQRHRVRPQHLLPQILQPGVDGGIGPAESGTHPSGDSPLGWQQRPRLGLWSRRPVLAQVSLTLTNLLLTHDSKGHTLGFLMRKVP